MRRLARALGSGLTRQQSATDPMSHRLGHYGSAANFRAQINPQALMQNYKNG